nr:hypothetical protein 30 [bacterium]
MSKLLTPKTVMVKNNQIIKAKVICEQTGESFPIYKTDTLKDVLPRYFKVFKSECDTFLKEIISEKNMLDNDKGFTKSKKMRKAVILPDILTAIIREYFPYYLSGKEGLKELKKLLPVCFIGNL